MNWTCRYCNRPQVVTDPQCDVKVVPLNIKGHKHEHVGVQLLAIVCANEECREISLRAILRAILGECIYADGRHQLNETLQTWKLLPASDAKPQPDFIPEPLRKAYYEACAIRDGSPQAAATLARRCIQGMIRDFCGIVKRTLNAEIDELRKQVEESRTKEPISADVVDAIDHVRSIGNIGAHMEQDINVVIDVEPEEAQLLIELIETLFDEWYVARQRRRERLASLAAAADAKKQLKAQGAPKQLPPPSDGA